MRCVWCDKKKACNTIPSMNLPKWVIRPGTAVLLWLMYALLVSSMVQHSPTVDEQSHLFRGIAYLKTGATHFLWGHPLLASSLNALPLLTEPNLQLPTDVPAWQTGDWAIAADAFLWQLNENPHRLVFLGRLPTVWVALLLAALMFRWGRELGGKTAAFLALVLAALDPNFLAHGNLITSDVTLTFFMLVAIYGYWRVCAWPTGAVRSGVLLIGAGVGAAAATKFSAAALLPMLGILVLWQTWHNRPKPFRLFALFVSFAGQISPLFVAGIIALGVVWGVYGFEIRPFPAYAYWQDLLWQLDYFSRPHGAYLLGQYHPTGWWYYFPVTFLLKTPLPTLLLLLSAFIWQGASGKFTFHISRFTFLPPLAYFLITLFTPLNIGYRHLLPMLPFLYLFIATSLATRSSLLPLRSSLFIFLALSTLLAWPHYIPFFNWLAGDADNRWRVLSDSNIDWGQDLPALAAWAAANQQQETQQPLYLSYFGTAHPSAYGLDFHALPTWEPGPEQLPAFMQPFNPADPAPGFYAISVTNLQGLVLGEAHDTFAWFRDREPIARLGGSIFVYEVEARGETADMVFAGLRPAELVAGLHAQLETNDVQVRWLNGRSAFVWPAAGGWLATTEEPFDEAIRPFLPPVPFRQSNSQLLYQLPTPPDFNQWGQPVMMREVQFLGAQILQTDADEAGILTAWRVVGDVERPLKTFVHALDTQGNIIGQSDRLDVDSLQPGDVFLQLHRFPAPSNQATQFRIGIYDANSLQNLAKPILLSASSIP